jgi:hypothetical protein
MKCGARGSYIVESPRPLGYSSTAASFELAQWPASTLPAKCGDYYPLQSGPLVMPSTIAVGGSLLALINTFFHQSTRFFMNKRSVHEYILCL